jgi:hypothetical protein
LGREEQEDLSRAARATSSDILRLVILIAFPSIALYQPM